MLEVNVVIFHLRLFEDFVWQTLLYHAGIQFVTIAAKGNAIEFGDNIYGALDMGAFANSVKGVIAGGYQLTLVVDQIRKVI